ncbi:MAG: PDZ domain-containing protein [Proteobacteria bacterium]|nr:PDZ domain-containing protein [Pseudomonadota bacterium]
MIPLRMKIRPFYSVFAVFLSFQALAAEGDRNFWKDTGLKAAHFEEDILGGCSADPVHFVGCVAALNALGWSLAEPRILTPGTRTPVLKGKVRKILSEPGSGMVIRALDPKPWAKFQMPPPGALSQQKVDELSAFERVLVSEMLDSLKSDASALRFDFRPLFRNWFEEAMKEDKFKSAGEAALVAMLYQADFRVTDDPHKELMATEAVKAMMAANAEEFSGVGLETNLMKRGVFISRVHAQGPAELAGILPGDELVSVNGEKAKRLGEPNLAFKIRGPEGSTVTLGMRRGKKPYKVDLVRAKIKSENVISSVLRRDGHAYGYIRIQSFMSQATGNETALALTSLKAEGAEKIILDLRNNLGGSLEEAVFVASLFLNSREVVHVEDLSTHVETPLSGYFSHQNEKIPLVVLVNFLSASASEIVAGALQEHGRAWIVGDRTFGKGLVQNMDYFHPERYGEAILLKQTTHIYRFPSGRTPHFTGVVPDFSVTEYPGGELIEPVTLREKDFYIGALPDAKAWRLSEWVEPREAQVRSISECRQRTGVADRLWSEWEDGGIGLMDYRLSVGLDFLGCIQP